MVLAPSPLSSEHPIYRWLGLGYLALLTGLFWLPDSSTYTKVFYGLMAAPALTVMLYKPATLIALLREPIVLAFLLLAAWAIISLRWSGTDSGVVSLSKRPLYVFMLFFTCTTLALADRAPLLRLLCIAAACASLAALINLLIFIITPPADFRLVGTGALRNPLLTSHVFGMFAAYWLATWLSGQLRSSWVALLLGLPVILTLLATGSRTPLLALAIMSVWMLCMTPRRASLLIATGSVLLAALWILSPDLLLQRGLSFRPLIWSDALDQATQHLWLGQGYDSKFTFHAEGLPFSLSDPHNVELAVLLELGVIGLVFWLLMHGFGLWRCFTLRHQPAFQIASAMLVYGIGAGLTEGSSFMARPNESWFLIWIPLSLISALSISHREQEK